MVLLGHNGAGKTTLLNYLMGFYTHPGQHPFLPGLDAFLEKKGVRLTEFSYAPEAAFLEFELSAADYVRLMGRLRGVGPIDPEPLMRRVALDISPLAPIKEYSKGMKQRLLLALALVGEPRTLILDEPTSGLDPYGREDMEERIAELAATHTVIVSTHSLRLAYRLDEEIWILKEGKVVFDGRVGSLQALEELVRMHRPGRLL